MVVYMIYLAIGALLAIYLLRRLYIRLQLSKAKHPSLRGHAKISKRIARFLPFYEYSEDVIFTVDGAPEDVASRRRQAFYALAERFATNAPKTLHASKALEGNISDVDFTNLYRVPFQFRNFVTRHMKIGLCAEASRGCQIKDLDDNWYYDLTGAYGVNLHGYDFYKACMEEGQALTRELGPVLGPYHPLVIENVACLKNISALDEVSFHMSGTEAVMQAVRLAHYHTRKPKTVVFCGAYHGWWDGVQPGVGNPRRVNDVYTLKENCPDTLHVLKTRNDIACVLVNPLQALNPNGGQSSDSMLVASDRHAEYKREDYTRWLKALREVCSEKGIVLIFDEVFLGFRLAKGGAQQYFGVRADMVTYGKTLGGGLPVGVVCGKHALMRRYRDNAPADVCFARGTFNSHPMVMGAMNAFLRKIEIPPYNIDFETTDQLWNRRAAQMNKALETAGLPLKMVNMSSIFVPVYTRPSRYNWMLQYYLRAEGLLLPWIGTGRFIFSHNYRDEDFETVINKIVAAGEHMEADGWWWQADGLSNRQIKRSVARELIAARFQANKQVVR
ncbi:MAG: glutamate-1-semialdehyde 2,1-aminomutase [Oleiphilus sp.]|nr:MAG: glutamate-1-semialdehyde 2,1-aminomutase [Oleiphilus sp.]